MSFKFIGLRNPIRKLYHFTRAVVAQYAAGFPSRDMIVIGITGTKWKTTTTNLITQWLIDAGESVAMFSTLRTYLGGVWETNSLSQTSSGSRGKVSCSWGVISRYLLPTNLGNWFWCCGSYEYQPRSSWSSWYDGTLYSHETSPL